VLRALNASYEFLDYPLCVLADTSTSVAKNGVLRCRGFDGSGLRGADSGLNRRTRAANYRRAGFAVIRGDTGFIRPIFV
jgi:hypothetical protein